MAEKENTDNSPSLKEKTSRGSSSLKEKTSRGSSSLKDKTSRGSSSLKDKTSRGSSGSSLKDRTSRSSSRSRSRGSRTSKKKENKKMLPIGFAILAVIILIGVLLAAKSALLGFFWLTGIAFGFILQKARFCFTASLRDPALTGSTSLTRAVLIAFAVTSIGFLAIQFGAHLRGTPIPGMSYVVPISLATAIGAFMFGIGMVISGGCASGTLMRVGEGFYMQMLSLVFFIIGSLWGAHDFGWWKYHFILRGKRIYLPDVFGWFGALLVQFLIIGVLYILADKWEHRGEKE